MTEQIQFETPENIQISYQPAGPGTRFIAWFVDTIIMIFLAIVMLIGLLIAGIATDIALDGIVGPMAENFDGDNPFESSQFLLYFMGIWTLIWGLGSFVYYGCSELFFRGQTIGKRNQHIRVVKVSGFSLDAGSIFVRNIFRVVDHLPPLWIVPVLSAKSQRLGDMVAGTLVVVDKPQQMNPIREVLSRRTTDESRFWFDATKLNRLRPQDIKSIEGILHRWSDLSDEQKTGLLNQVVPPLVERMQTEVPGENDRLRFLEDLLAAEYRRQDRSLG